LLQTGAHLFSLPPRVIFNGVGHGTCRVQLFTSFKIDAHTFGLAAQNIVDFDFLKQTTNRVFTKKVNLHVFVFDAGVAVPALKGPCQAR
jgi:hypothetical protein